MVSSPIEAVGMRVGTEARKLSVGEKISLTLVAIGATFLLLALFAPVDKLVGIGRGWLYFGLSFGLLAIGAATFFIQAFKQQTPGIKHHGIYHSGLLNRGVLGWVAGVSITTFYVTLYWHGQALSGLVRVLDSLSQALRGGPADQWFLYGTLYTFAVVVMGVRMMMKYRHNRYHLIRTGSVMFFQLGFAWLLPGILRRLNQPEFYFSYFWPLKPEYAYPDYAMGLWSKGNIGMVMVLWAAGATLIATPALTYFFGKRWYCSWVCGCGGLAETLGDPWRQLSDKGTKAWKIERWLIHSVLLAIAMITALLWIDHLAGNTIFGASATTAKKWYGFFIGAIFSGVIGVGFYPLMGSRVWCRFGCPMAATLGILQRFFSRFRITTNGGQCISCGNCSTYCEMGIDVRAYAQRGENIVRASCVGCGVCAAVCPRGVLKLENGPVGDRFENASQSLVALKDALRGKPQSK